MGWITFYKIGIFLYHSGISIASLWSKKAKDWQDGRKKVWPKKPANQSVIWFHASSLGEFEQGRPIMEMWRKHFPQHHILLTFFSPSGFAISHENTPADTVMFLPKEKKSTVKKWFKHWQPEAGIFFKYDFWLIYLLEAKKNNIPVFFTSVLLRENQFFFRSFGRGYLRLLEKTLSHWICHNRESADLLKKHGISNVSVGGDTRIDRVHQRSLEPFHDDIIEDFSKDNIVLVVGSSWPAEEEMLAMVKPEFPNIKIILAPHDVSENHLSKIEKRFENQTHRWSNGLAPKEKSILIVNTIGKLSGLYRYGDFAFIGGGFGKSVHNTLEPAAYGMAVCFGPRHEKFTEPGEMISLGFGYCVENENDLRVFIKEHLDESNRIAAKKNAEVFFKKHKGASQKTFDCILEQLVKLGNRTFEK